MTVSEDYSAIQDVNDHERMYIGQVFSIRRVIKLINTQIVEDKSIYIV